MLTLVTGIAGLLVLIVILELLRRRQLREKYAMLWLAVGILVIPAALFPQIGDNAARALGIASGVSLVLFLGILFLLFTSIHLSWEVSRLEEETRTLAEDLALLRTEIRTGRTDPHAVKDNIQ